MLFSARSLPNLLGLFRIITTPMLVWLILDGSPSFYLWAVLLLLVMALSDMADGRIARRLKVVSPLGIFLDTISDKIFVAGALLPMIQAGMISSWIAFIIIVREFVISGLRSFAAAEGTVISAGKLGKQKLVIQVVAIIWRLLAANMESGGILSGNESLAWLLSLWPLPMALAVIWTIVSGLEYLWNAWPLLRSSWSPRPTTD
ncbi:CDP-diacylglycerol--glycerol-3-phosphate 3-phosphatidyltransferase [Chloroflexales bacterium ZM16-3]|nr:CDP-diacylglycerol--glycerol-3-phosphate 3-phosphatidyltransferase [Chloroflexales bacterium ZM16-3]